MNLRNLLKRPEYLWRPGQIIRRFSRIGRKPAATEDLTLPWGAGIRVRIAENIGSDIYHYGIFDPIVPETIWRLLDRGETAIDVGANIGQNTSLMAFRAAASGCVIAFEPHPMTFQELQQNFAGWNKDRLAPIQLENVALGNEHGHASLSTTTYLSGARLSSAENGIKVQLRPLDSFLLTERMVGVCKIDVEGHELGVLQGAEQTLSRRGIRDIIFEDFDPKPSAVTRLLQGHGYAIFELHKSWLKPRIIPLGEKISTDFTFNYLATLNVARTESRFKTPGWRCLIGL